MNENNSVPQDSHLRLHSKPQFCFVISSIKPYCFDFEQIFALPSGFKYRQRYDERWVEASLKSQVSTMQGCEVLIVFWNTSTKTLYPVRWGTITTAQKVGRILYFDYTLNDFVQYEPDVTARNSQINAFNETFRGFHPDIVGHGESGFRDYVLNSRVGQNLSRTGYQDLTNWGTIVDEVAKAEVFQDVEFLKIMDLQEGMERSLQPFGDGYRLRDGRTYRMRVFQIVPNPRDNQAPPHDIELNSFIDQIQLLRRRQTAVGKYDVLTYVFKLSGVPYGEQTAFELRPVAASHISDARYQTFYIPIFVAPPSRTESFLRLAGIVIGLSLIFIPLLFGLEHHPLSGYVGMITFVISVIGMEGLKKAFEPFRTKG